MRTDITNRLRTPLYQLVLKGWMVRGLSGMREEIVTGLLSPHIPELQRWQAQFNKGREITGQSGRWEIVPVGGV